MNVKTAAEKWGCSESEVRGWCRDGDIEGTVKEKRRWEIPDDAKRPFDRKMQKDVLWQVLRWKDNHQRRIDLTCWGIDDKEIINYISLLVPIFIRVLYGPVNAGNLDSLELTDKGYALIGYGKEIEAEKLPKVIRWGASATGVFAAAFTSESFRQVTGLS